MVPHLPHEQMIGILYHPKKADTKQVASLVRDWLRQRDKGAWIRVNTNKLANDNRLKEADLLIVLGGDGATLRTARMASPYNIPIICINMGRIGFLAEANLDNWQDKLSQYIAGKFWIEKRIMLKAEVYRGDEMYAQMMALNDVVVGRGNRARVVRLTLLVDGDLITQYTADALIVATPTGSTAYSMAAGGPLLPPVLQNFLVIPVAPHLSLNRAIVLHKQATITIEVEMDHDASVTADGQAFAHLQSGDRVVLQQHHHETSFVRVESSGYFYRRLMQRLGVIDNHTHTS